MGTSTLEQPGALQKLQIITLYCLGCLGFYSLTVCLFEAHDLILAVYYVGTDIAFDAWLPKSPDAVGE
jgi:hypothetical protein